MRSKHSRASVLLTSFFIISLFVLLFLATVAYRQLLTLNQSSRWVSQSLMIGLELERLLSGLKEAESGQRGYIITRDTSILKSFADGRKSVYHSFNGLKQLVKDNPLQEKYLDKIYQQIDQRFFLLDRGIKLSVSAPALSDTFHRHLLKGKITMDVLTKTVDKMKKSEQELLLTREQKLANDITITPVKSLFLVLFSLLVFTFSFFKINRDVKQFKKANDQLMLTNKAFAHAEAIVGISNWQLNLDTNEMVYSDNQYRMLGCEGRCFDPGFENFLEFVHPDDRRYLRSEWEKTINEQKAHSSLFRVIKQDGEIRFFKSIGKLITDSSDHKIIIGINQDITELHLNQLSLEEKNKELKSSNAELASFNHIASHDLQEPLRKIQMFISRILERDMSFVSEASKEIFAKIQSSAMHMQNLIDDLLMFSRATRSDQPFEKADLNLLFEHAVQELGPLIEEKSAIIDKGDLPRLIVIPFQIQQLFGNLINNSLKFIEKGTTPHISIHAEMIKGKDVPSPNALPRKRYWKITFSDNGIGFESQYAEKIFVLFNRLHDKSVYSGTGIGLAICKKIVDNHSGYILAESVSGKGATFNIFLPI